MKIFVNDEAYKIPTKDLDVLKTKFPRFFKKENTAGIQFEFDTKLNKKFIDRFQRSHEHLPEQRNISLQGRAKIGGETVRVNCSNNYEKEKATDKMIYHDRIYTINRSSGLRADSPVELLWFMWFASNDIKNNGNDLPKSTGARVSFFIEEEKAVNNLVNVRLVNKLTTILLDLEEDRLIHFAQNMQEVFTQGIDDLEVLRNGMITKMTSSKEYRDRLNTFLSNEGKVPEEVFNIIGRLKTSGKIKLDGRSKEWKWVDKEVEDVLIHKASTAEKLSPDEQLARRLMGDAELLKEFKEEVKLIEA